MTQFEFAPELQEQERRGVARAAHAHHFYHCERGEEVRIAPIVERRQRLVEVARTAESSSLLTREACAVRVLSCAAPARVGTDGGEAALRFEPLKGGGKLGNGRFGRLEVGAKYLGTL